MYLSVDMMTALIFWIIRFDTPHKALTCVCDALSLQKVKWNTRFFISERLGIRTCNQQLLQDFSWNNKLQKKVVLQNSVWFFIRYHVFFFSPLLHNNNNIIVANTLTKESEVEKTPNV